MKTIFKYPLTGASYQDLYMPTNAQILKLDTQNGTPCIWALIDPNESIERIEIRIFYTGEPIYEADERLHYIGTYKQNEDSLIFHVFKLDM